MKKKGKFLLLLVMIFLLTGCGKAPQEESGYTVYYVDTAGTRLMESNYVPSAQTFDELMDELIEMMQQPPTTGFVSALQGNVSVEGYERGIDALRIDFSKEYYDLGNTEEVLLRAAVVKTFSQIPGVTKVMITVEKEQLCDAQGQPVPAMDADSFIDTKEGGINSYLYAKLALYFSNEDGTQLVREARNLHYSSNMVLERVVIEQLIEGPSEGGKAVLPESTKIQSVSIKKGICTVNFDSEANKEPSESMVNPRTALYAIVDSICETCDEITGVRFEVEGESDVKFRQTVDLDQTFTMDRSYIEEVELETQTSLTEKEVPETATEDAVGISEHTAGEETGETSPRTGGETEA